MKYCILIIWVALISTNCSSNSEKHISQESLTNIDSLNQKLKNAALASLNYQISNLTNKHYLEQIKNFKEVIKISSEPLGLRNGFCTYLSKNKFYFDSDLIKEIYLVETESSGEVFTAINYLFLIDINGDCNYYKYSLEYGKWSVSKKKICNININKIYSDLEYSYNCKNNKSLIDKLIISRILQNKVDSKVIVEPCKEVFLSLLTL